MNGDITPKRTRNIDGMRRPDMRLPRPVGAPVKKKRPVVDRNPVSQPVVQDIPREIVQPQATAITPISTVTGESQPRKKNSKRWIWGIIIGLIVVAIGICAALFAWYNLSLLPVNSNEKAKTAIKIPAGSSTKTIATILKSNNLIRDENAFGLYVRLNDASLQAGSYRLSPSESVESIVNHLKSGKTDSFNIQFFPGATLRDDSDKPRSKKMDVTTVLLNAGYSEEEIEAALAKKYDHPLFADKPSSTDLEGYVYGETYTVSTDASVEDILKHTFDIYYKAITDNGLIDGFKQHNLNLFQGITLASIVQREVGDSSDQPQVAQVFLKRLSENTVLGSDVTFIYAAHKLGVEPTVDLKSPYNTRQVAGLPPGPIASPGLSAMKSVAHPADGDYLYFVAGEDGKTYFARTEAEHEANVAAHCGKLCQ